MIFVLSPAKALDFESTRLAPQVSQPRFLGEAGQLIEVLRTFSPQEVATLMDLSNALAALNVARYETWTPEHTPENSRACALAFNGDVYEGLQAETLDTEGFLYAQDHIRILSGLYGVLRPLDLMQPYRLEMGSKLATVRGRTLYEFWDNKITESLASDLAGHDARVLVNLASEEYFKSVRTAGLRAELVLQIVFEEWKSGTWKIVSFHAKRARGLMARFAIDHRIRSPEALQGFDAEGYRFAESASTATRWVFRRRTEV